MTQEGYTPFVDPNKISADKAAAELDVTLASRENLNRNMALAMAARKPDESIEQVIANGLALDKATWKFKAAGGAE